MRSSGRRRSSAPSQRCTSTFDVRPRVTTRGYRSVREPGRRVGPAARDSGLATLHVGVHQHPQRRHQDEQQGGLGGQQHQGHHDEPDGHPDAPPGAVRPLLSGGAAAQLAEPKRPLLRLHQDRAHLRPPPALLLRLVLTDPSGEGTQLLGRAGSGVDGLPELGLGDHKGVSGIGQMGRTGRFRRGRRPLPRGGTRCGLLVHRRQATEPTPEAGTAVPATEPNPGCGGDGGCSGSWPQPCWLRG